MEKKIILNKFTESETTYFLVENFINNKNKEKHYTKNVKLLKYYLQLIFECKIIIQIFLIGTVFREKYYGHNPLRPLMDYLYSTSKPTHKQ